MVEDGCGEQSAGLCTPEALINKEMESRRDGQVSFRRGFKETDSSVD